MRFKNYIKQIKEETSSVDIATVDNKLGSQQKNIKHLQKGKKCKKHKQLNCEDCTDEQYDN